MSDMQIIVNKIPEKPEDCIFHEHIEDRHHIDFFSGIFCKLSNERCTDTYECDKLMCITDFSYKPSINMAGEDGDYYHCRQCKNFVHTDNGKYGAIIGYCKFNLMKRPKYGANRACKKFDLNDQMIIGSFLANQISGKE